MSNADVVSTLKGLQAKASSASTDSIRRVLFDALDAARAEIQPTADQLSAAAASWEQAASRWTSTRTGMTGLATGLPSTWTGTAASACQDALVGYTTAAATPVRGAGDVAGSLLRLKVALEPFRTNRAESLKLLETYEIASASVLRLMVPPIIATLVSAYESADTAASTAAGWVHEAAHDLAFPSKAMSQAVSPFLRAVAPMAPTPSTGKRPAAGTRGAPAARRPAAKGAPAARRRAAGGTVHRPAVKGAPAKRPAPVRRPTRATGPAAHRATTPVTRHPAATKHPSTSTHAVPARPHGNAVTPKAPPLPTTASGKRGQVLAIANGYKGIPYVWGGTTPRGFDCSGLTQYVYRQVGVNLPRLAEAQRFAGRTVPHSQARPGDLVCMAHHVGIYVGNGMMLNAPHTGAVVRTQRIWTDAYTVVRVLP